MRYHGLPASLVSLIVLIGLAVAGCDTGRGHTAPGVTTPTGGTATIAGSLTRMPGAPSAAGATVRVAGSTTAPVTIDSNESFTLVNVPTGTQIVLIFSGSDLNTSVPIGVLNFADRIVLNFAQDATGAVRVTGAPNPNDRKPKDFVGRIDSVSSANRSFVVLGQTIRTDASTVFLRNDGTPATFFDLFVGLGVVATTVPASSGAVLATIVRLEDIGIGVSVVLTGTISNVSRDGRSFQFIVQGRLVRGDETTVFANGRTSDGLRDGVTVEVAGIARIGFIQATQIRF